MEPNDAMKCDSIQSMMMREYRREEQLETEKKDNDVNENENENKENKTRLK
jgi:hypothetical protein